MSRMLKPATTLLLAIALVVAPAPAPAQHRSAQQQLRLEWSKNVTEFGDQPGRLLTVVCPPDGHTGNVWGTDSYTTDSSVCTAAVHAGVITVQAGGPVTIVIGPSRTVYAGSTRNGVTSQQFASAWSSFSFAERGAEGVIDWGTRARGLVAGGPPLTLVCPSDGTPDNVWGTDVYTDDSSICAAAVHAGIITLASGGRVAVQSRGSLAQFTSSARGGVRSRDWSGAANTFGVSAPAGALASNSSLPATFAATRASSVAPPAAAGAPTAAAVLNGDRTPIARPGAAALGAPASLAAPTNVRAQPLYYRGTVMVQWDTMPGATGYDILQKLPDGKYAGANPYERGPYGPERSQGITMQLAPGPLAFSVVAHYGPDGQDSPPSAPASVVIPRWYGRYRVSILGFKVERETADDPLETDGKHDEVYLRLAVSERGPEGDPIGPVVERQTLVHGDVNLAEWRSVTSPTHRIKAGSASVDGGLRSGDAVPTTTPWLRTDPSNYATSFPLLVWEGDLLQGHNSVQVAFNLWEADRRPGQAPPPNASALEAQALELAKPAAIRFAPTLAGTVVRSVTSNPALGPALASLLAMSSSYADAPAVARSMVLDDVRPRLPGLMRASLALDSIADAMGATALALKMGNGLAGQQSAIAAGVTRYFDVMNSFLTAVGENAALELNLRDRPIGVRRDFQGKLVALPGALTLTFESAEREALAGNGPHNIGPGIYQYRFDDGVLTQGGNGRYVVYLQVQRIQ